MVKFGGTSATGFSVENSTAIIATAPAHSAGLVYVNVTTPEGTAAGAGKFTYVPLPTITSVLSPTGPVAGGTTVKIKGTNFLGATAVKFGGTDVTSFTVENITSIDAITPAHAAGAVYVNVTTPNGTAVGTRKYTYVALPSITSVLPATGPVNTEIPIIITGANLIGAVNTDSSIYNVSFGGSVLTNMTVVSATSIRGSVQSGTAGSVNVNITTPNGTSVTGTGKFTFVNPPTFVSISPMTGSLAGNTPITITGTNLVGAKNNAVSVYNVTIGGNVLTNMTVVSATRIIGSTKPGTPGLADLIITTPNGTASVADGFTYVEAQTLTGVTPQTGPIAGGTWVNITGTNLVGATGVTFGGTAATGVQVENSTAIIVKTPAHAVGVVSVNVTTPNGTAAGPGAFTYIALPTVTSVLPATGPIVGGIPVNITGTNFIAASAVTFGGTAATSFSVENTSAIIAVVPAHAAGAVTVNVVTPNGTAAGTNKYTYVALPSITSVLPATGPVNTEIPVIITGANLIGAVNTDSSIYNVSLGGTVLTNMTVVSATSIRGSIRSETAGLVNVNITTPNGTALTGTGKFTFVDPPTFVSISPLTGSLAGNTPITITGTNLVGAKNNATSLYNVSIGGNVLTNMTVVNATRIVGSTPAGTSGLTSLIISTPNGTVSASEVFTYVEAQTLTRVTPQTGPIAGGTWVNITGTNLVGATGVTFGGSAATGVQVENSTAIIAKAPAHAAGLVSVNVTTPNGTAAGPGAFTYIALPTVTSVSPATGPIAGGTPVNITGTNFASASAVTFGGTAATSFSVENNSAVIAVVPAHAAGAVTVNVVTPNGTGAGTNKYTYVALPTITSVSPATGPVNTEIPITITGSNLIGAVNTDSSIYNASLGGTVLTNMTVVSATSIRGSIQSETAGPVNVNITTPNGTAVTGTGKFTFVNPPSFTSISPTTGSLNGNTPIIITGTNLIGVKNNVTSLYNVSIGGSILTNMTVINATKIIGSTRPGTAGLADIIITTSNGTISQTGAFTYVEALTIDSVAPSTGPIVGGTWVNITGMNLVGATGVTFGGTAATGVQVENSTAIIAKTPVHAAGLVVVNVTTPNGTVAGPGAFTYIALPTVTSVSPATGPIAGGTPVNITGTNFAAASAVTFGGTAVTSFLVENVSSIMAVVPAHATGTVYVNVTTPNGTALGASKFTYVSLPSITSITPATGPVNTEIPAIITGANLIGAVNTDSSIYNVSFGGIILTNMTVVSATSIRGSIRSETAGPVNVNITTPNGTAVTGTGKFTFVDPPAITGITPATGSLAGNTPITITGTNLVGAKNNAVSVYNVTIGGNVLTNMTVVSATRIIGSTKPGTPGLADLIITTPNGTASVADGFTYVEAQTLTGVTPQTGPIAGGTWVNITGTNLVGATGVTFGGTAATGVQVENSTAIIVKIPAHAAGVVSVNVTTPNGTAAGPGVFTYISLPTVTSVSPATGPVAGNTQVNITGTNFTAASAVTFGGTAATSFSVENTSAIIAVVPAHAAGAVTVNVVTPNGTAAGTNKYTYVALPSITSVLPVTGPLPGGTSVTIRGTNLIGASIVTFGGNAAPGFSVENSSTIIVINPAHALGAVNINVTTPNGTTVSGTNKFTYVAQPAVTSIKPAGGPLEGGTWLNITGTNLIGTTAVIFGDSTATGVQVENSTVVLVRTPAHVAGSVPINLSTPNGTVIIPGGYTYAEPPTIISLAPKIGINTRTIAIANLKGTGFYGTPVVRLTRPGQADITATDVTIASSTKISCTFDLVGKAAGLWNVTVINPDGQKSILLNGFTISDASHVPTISGIVPATGKNLSLITITNISGTQFVEGAVVNLTRRDHEVITATNVSVLSPTQITCTVDLTNRTSGFWDVVVTTPDTPEASLSDGFLVISSIVVPVTDFSATPHSGSAPMTVQFFDNSTESPIAWNWSFGDGTFAAAQNPSHTYIHQGRFNVSLTATNRWGSNTTTWANYITVSDIRAGFIANTTNGTVSFPVAFTDTSTGSPVSWNWSFGDGNYSSQQNPVYTFIEPKVFNVTLLVGNTAGITNSTMQQVTGYATKVITTSAINGTQSSTIGGNQTMIVNLTSIETTGGTVDATDTTVTIRGGNTFWKNTRVFAKKVSSNPGTGNYSVTNVTQVIMASIPVVASLNNSIGDVSVSLDVALKEYIPNAAVDITINEGATTETVNAFQLAAQSANISIRDIAYTIHLANTESINTNLTMNATQASRAIVLNMTVNHSWVAQYNNGQNNDGRDAVSILRYPESGSPQVLTTRFIAYDPVSNLDSFEADSPDGLSIFGLTSVAAVSAPGAGASSVSGASSGIPYSPPVVDSSSLVSPAGGGVSKNTEEKEVAAEPAPPRSLEEKNTQDNYEQRGPLEDFLWEPVIGTGEQNGSSFIPATASRKVPLIIIIGVFVGAALIGGTIFLMRRRSGRNKRRDL